MPRLTSLLLLAVCVLPASAQTGGDSTRALHLLSRTTFGVRPRDVAELLRMGERPWLEAQLAPATAPADSAVARRFPTTALPMGELIRTYAPRPNAPAAGDSMMRAAQALAGPQRVLAELASARLYRAVASERQLEEVMTRFWYEHFNVFAGKGIDRYLVADYERIAIRAHVFGRFEDMLLAVARHPAMLFYLDNWQSVSIDSTRLRRFPRAAAAAQGRGLNENYARELLELHTLGVDGGYTQADVQAVARAFTGWSFTAPRPNDGGGARDVQFIFRPAAHDVREKRILGHTLAAGRGEEDGREVLQLLAHHPRTAQFIAHKLVERFVNDEGDTALEAELAAVFARTGGNLRAVTYALFASPRFHAAEHRNAKVKTPFELVASALRVLQLEPAVSRPLLQTLRGMGEAPYGASDPTGYPASSEEWVNGGALLARMNFGIELASGRINGVRRTRRTTAAGDVSAPVLAALADSLLPGRDTRALQARILREVNDQPNAAARAVGLLLGSPEFQRR